MRGEGGVGGREVAVRGSLARRKKVGEREREGGGGGSRSMEAGGRGERERDGGGGGEHREREGGRE